jgi:hypothetical protein
MTPHRPRLDGGLMLGTRRAAAVLLHRHENMVRRHCRPVACDVDSRALLYDLDDCDRVLRPIQRRVA